MDDRLLRTTMTVNALLSGATGAGIAALAGVLDAPLGIPAPILVGVGLALLPWSAALWWARSRDEILRRDARTAIAGDVAWVLASAIVLAASPAGLTTAGHWAVGIVAAGVADAALLQALGLRRMTRRVSRIPTGRRPAVR